MGKLDYYYSSFRFNPDKNPVSMDYGVINRLKKYFDIRVCGENSTLSSSCNGVFRLRHVILLDYDIISIYQYEDEWFEVIVGYDDKVKKYWCDQFEGLFRFLDDHHDKPYLD